MKKQFLLRATVLAIASSGSLATIADDAVESQSQDEKIVVTANRIQQDINDTLTDVEIITRADIEKIQPRSLIDLLVNVSGLDSVQKGGHAQDSSLFVRGANSNQVLVLIDGVRVGSATLGEKSISNIPMAQVERVEIVKGPRAAIWGSDAIGGVIQIFTRRYLSSESRIGVTMGSNDSAEVDVALGFGDETLNNTVTYSHKKSDGFDVRIDDENDDDGFKNDSIAMRGSYQKSEHHTFDWVAQVDKGQYDFDTSYLGNQSHYKNHFWNLRYLYHTNEWNHQLAWSVNRDRFYSVGNGVTRATAGNYETRREQYNYLTRHQINQEFSFSGGIEWLLDDIRHTTSDYALKQRESKSAQIGFNYIGELWLADLAVRYDDIQRVNSETSVNFGIGFRIADNHLLSINYAEGFKAPTFNDLYYPYGGNPELNFELSDNIELVYKGDIFGGRLTVSVYESEIENLIQWTPDSEGAWTPQNVGEAEISGVDLTYKLTHGNWSHQLTASHTKAENTTTKQQLLRRAKEQAGYQLSYAEQQLDWFAQIQYVGERPDNDFQTYSPMMLDSYVRLNLGVAYELNTNWKFQLKVNDALDEAPTQVSGYYPVEREFYFTVSYQTN
ncbi:TonB-dependent receptor domain-containing protein [Aliikangiella maris]|uniref:TonB-dependent receptor n=2 Tax=Aliikangiella maris TaxID=3162458 RepID=A0ABV2BWD1_9GAMM